MWDASMEEREAAKVHVLYSFASLARVMESRGNKKPFMARHLTATAAGLGLREAHNTAALPRGNSSLCSRIRMPADIFPSYTQITEYSLGRNPQGSSSPTLKWKAHTGIEPTALVLWATCSTSLGLTPLEFQSQLNSHVWSLMQMIKKKKVHVYMIFLFSASQGWCDQYAVRGAWRNLPQTKHKGKCWYRCPKKTALLKTN